MVIQSGSIANGLTDFSLMLKTGGVHFAPVTTDHMKTPNTRFLLAVVISSATVVAFAIRSKDPKPASLGCSATSPAAAKLALLPPIILWAWERPEKLGFIDPARVGVAFLAKTLHLAGDRVLTRPRLQPLNVPEGTKVIAVVRIETDRTNRPRLDSAQIENVVSEVTELAQLPKVSAVQIDFDATVSERDFYRRLLVQVRALLPSSLPLSITALASWCQGDNWLSDLPIDEAIPMLFRLGINNRRFTSQLQSGQAFLAPPCRASAGVSTDEPVTPPLVRRLYIFNPNSWTQSTLNSAMEAYER
jgi:Protein of unknown function (DUF3142)